MSVIDYVLIAAIILLLIVAVRYIFKRKKRCGGSCSGCGCSESCNFADK